MVPIFLKCFLLYEITQLKSIWFDLVKHFILIFRKVDNIFHRISQVCLHLLPSHQLPNCQKCIIFHKNFWVCHDHDDGGTSVFHIVLSAQKILHWFPQGGWIVIFFRYRLFIRFICLLYRHLLFLPHCVIPQKARCIFNVQRT